MLVPYPEIKVSQSHRLRVSDLHSIYIEESGSVDGHPALIFHDGPGFGADPFHRRLFDAERFRIIQFDQRGCGRSVPFAETAGNLPADSVADVMRILEHLDIEKIVLVGFGWGARLAREFASAHPDRVISAVLCGYGFDSKANTDWLFGGGAKDLFPDEWAILLKSLNVENASGLLSVINQHMSEANELVQIHTAKAFAQWMAKISSLHINRSVIERFTLSRNALSMTKLAAATFARMSTSKKDKFLPELRETDFPGILVHGRYDAVCPLSCAYECHQQWTQSELFIVRDAGHSIYDPAMTDAMVRTIGMVADRLDGVGKLNG